jgi:hypothetical protein
LKLKLPVMGHALANMTLDAQQGLALYRLLLRENGGHRVS